MIEKLISEALIKSVKSLYGQHLPEKLANSRLYNETKTLSGRAEIFREIFEISNKMFGVASVQWHKDP